MGAEQKAAGVVRNDAPRHKVRSSRENLLLKVSRVLPLKGQFGEPAAFVNCVTWWISNDEVGPIRKAEFQHNGVWLSLGTALKLDLTGYKSKNKTLNKNDFILGGIPTGLG